MRTNKLSAVGSLVLLAGLACSAAPGAQPPTQPITATWVAWHNEQGDLVFDSNWDGCLHPASAWFHGVGDLPGGAFASDARGISPDGLVVVGFSDAAPAPDEPGASTAFVFTACTGIAPLAAPTEPGFSSEAVGASFNGDVIVGAAQLSRGVGCRWVSSGGVEILTDVSGALSTVTTGVSSDGNIVVGSAFDSSYSRAFIFTAGSSSAVRLGALPGAHPWSEAAAVSATGAVVVGRSTSNRGIEAFRWSASSGMVGLGGLPGAPVFSSAAAVSSDGLTIVGRATTTTGREAFRWTQATGMVALGDFPGGADSSGALAISASGATIVGYATGPRGPEAFIYDPAHGMRNLHDVLNSQNAQGLSGWTLTAANAISADGLTIVGSGIDPSGNFQGWVAHLTPGCRADYNGDDVVNSLDLFDFLNAMYAGAGDFNHDGQVNSQDLFDFLANFFAGC